MSVAVCRGPVMPAFEAPCWLKPAPEPYKPVEPVAVVERRPSPPARVDIWNAIQADVDSAKKTKKEAYVHPLVRRSSSRLLSQKSLEVCTESLGNETGSGDFTACLDDLFNSPLPAAAEDSSFWENNNCDSEENDEECEEELAAVNYHSARWSSGRRAFPPPLPSMSRRDGPCLQMRSRREDGRLVVEAVPVRPRGFLHATRQGGRLRLAFVECSASPRAQKCSDAETEINRITTAAVAAGDQVSYFPAADEPKNEEGEEEIVEEMEEEEEVEVVDRGTVVEVKVMSTQPQTPTSAAKVHRSRLVINKFVGGTPLSDQPRSHNHTDATTHSNDDNDEPALPSPPPKLRRVPSSTTTLAAAVAEASSGSDDDDECGGVVHMDASAVAEPKQLLLLTSRRGDKQDILQSVRRCRQLRQKPLFILEPYCIATT